MPAMNHPDYGEELNRCKYTLGYVEKSLKTTLSKKGRIDSDLDKVRKHFNVAGKHGCKAEKPHGSKEQTVFCPNRLLREIKN